MGNDPHPNPEADPTHAGAELGASRSALGLREVVHELGNLLDGATRTLYLARASGGVLDGAALDAAAAALEEACVLVHALADTSNNIGRSMIGNGDIAEQIRHAVQLLRPMAAERKIELIEYADSALSQVPPSALHAVLINVIRNGIEAVGSAGRVEVRARLEPEAAPERAMIVIEVIDDGPGPDASVGDRIFEPGVSTKATGAGIGLALVRDTIRGLGGTVTLERACQSGGGRLTIAYPVPRSPVHCKVTGEGDTA